MTHFALYTVLAAVWLLASMLRAALPRRHCRPSNHLVTVVSARRIRDGLSRRYWIRCRMCDLERGPYGDWQAAWHDVLGEQIAARRRAVSATVPPAGERHDEGPR